MAYFDKSSPSSFQNRFLSQGINRSHSVSQNRQGTTAQLVPLGEGWERIEYGQLKARITGQHGWTGKRIDDLLAWSKSFKQFRSIVENVTLMEFEHIENQFPSGNSLPVKISDINKHLQNEVWLKMGKDERDSYNLPDLDRLASYLLTILYSTEHLEFQPDISFTDEEVKQKKRQDESLPANNNLAKSTLMTRELAARMQRMQQVHGQDENIIPVKQNVSDIGYYCVATGVHKGILYVSFNYKKTQYYIQSGTKMERQLVSSNTISSKALNNIRNGLSNFLKGSKSLSKLHVQFLKASTNRAHPIEEAHAPAHAEMQLVKELNNALKSVGVSKPCCKHCTSKLNEKSVNYHSTHDRHVSNWSLPKDFTVDRYHSIGASKQVMTFRFDINRLNTQKKRRTFKSRINKKYPGVMQSFDVAHGKVDLRIDTSKFASEVKEKDYMLEMDPRSF